MDARLSIGGCDIAESKFMGGCSITGGPERVPNHIVTGDICLWVPE